MTVFVHTFTVRIHVYIVMHTVVPSSTDENDFDLDCAGSASYLQDSLAEYMYRSLQKKSVSVTFPRHLSDVLFETRLTSNLHIALATQNSTRSNMI